MNFPRYNNTLFMSIYIDSVQLATEKEIVVAWWGKGHPPVGHIMSEGPHVNSTVCNPQDEDTMVTEEPAQAG